MLTGHGTVLRRWLQARPAELEEERRKTMKGKLAARSSSSGKEGASKGPPVRGELRGPPLAQKIRARPSDPLDGRVVRTPRGQKRAKEKGSC